MRNSITQPVVVMPDVKIMIAGRFQVLEKIGSGSFGVIHKGHDVVSGESVAIKLEPLKVKPSSSQLTREIAFYEKLAMDRVCGVAQVLWSGEEGDYRVMIMELLGPSLQDLLEYVGGRFSLKTTMLLATQMINRMEYVHSKLVVHRDIKPENFVMGTGGRGNILYVIDFGLSKDYADAKTCKHIPYKEGHAFTGTARYATPWTHLGLEYSRRDDIMSIGYMLCYFLRGKLPWQGLGKLGNPKAIHGAIACCKVKTNSKSLCAGCPPALEEYIRYAASLRYEQKPDYNYLRSLFMKSLQTKGHTQDSVYDWS
ncbi:Discs overgrown protein kinase [Diplonema papillatum]|nr:Discs overgrown protein kinase [Diplonema papillatum]|eukprot:gene22410-34321_t